MTFLCFPSNPLVIQGHKMFFYELSINLFSAVLKQRSLQGPVTLSQIILKCAYCSVGSLGNTLWSSLSGRALGINHCGGWRNQDIRTGRSSGLPWILTKASDDPTGNSAALMALQGSLRMRWGVKPLFFPSDKSSDSGLLGKYLGVVTLDWVVLLIQGQFLERSSVESIQPTGSQSILVPRWEMRAAYHSIRRGCNRNCLHHLHGSPQNSQLWYAACLHLVSAKIIAFPLFYHFFKLLTNVRVIFFFNCLSKWC